MIEVFVSFFPFQKFVWSVQAMVKQLLDCHVAIQKTVGEPNEEGPIARSRLVKVVGEIQAVHDWAEAVTYVESHGKSS